MGRKKRSSQNSNNVITNEDSSESESSKESTQGCEANKTACPHISKSVEANNVRKCLKTIKDKNIHWFCILCKKNKTVQCEDGWVCLRCAAYNCGPDEENHRVDHYKTPRSDTHYLAFHVNTNKIWCFKCEQEVPIDATKNVQNCVDFIKKMYRPTECSVEVDSDKNGNDSNLAHSKPDTSLGANLQKVSLNKDEAKPALNLPRVRGLVNLGNTCFFNSVLQCLAQTPGLVELLQEMDIPGEKFHLELDDKTIDAVLGKPVPMKPSFILLCEQLVQILPEVSGVAQKGDGDARSGSHTVNPKWLLNALTKRCPQFEGGDQHDAHELLRHLLDSVHSEDLRRYQKAILDHIGYSNKDELDEDKKEFAKKLNHKVCDTIPIRPDQIFKGSLVSILQCDVCKHISKRAEPFLDLSLPVAQEKAQPPRRKLNCSSPVEAEQTTEVTLSKHQQKKEKRTARRNQKNNYRKKDQAQGEPTIDEEGKIDSLDGEQSDADVEDNEDNACEEQDHKTEIVESGYSSEKQMSARGSPITTQSPEEESKYNLRQVSNDLSNYQGCETNPNSNKPFSEIPVYTFINTSTEGSEVSLAKRAESGIGSIQELTLTIPEEINTECASQDSVRVNASNGSPNVSLDSHHNHFKTVDLTSVDYNLPQNMENHIDRSVMVQEWNCMVDPKLQGQGSSCVSLSVSPQCGSQSSQDNNVSPKCSPKGSPMSGSHSNENMSLCTSLPVSNDNMSVCNSLPENISMILNSPVKSLNSQRDENSGSEERLESRLECQKNRSSPVEMGETTQLDSSLLKLSLEGMTSYSEQTERMEDIEVSEDNMKPIIAADPHITATDSSAIVVDLKTNQTAIPLPPPPPTKNFICPENPVQRCNSGSMKYKIEEGECSLLSCLNQFTVTEMLAGANKVGCEGCTERINKGNKEGKTVYQNSTKQLLICKLPPVMIFHLKRFQLQNCSFRKISRHVDFPLVLDVSQFCVKNELKKVNEPMLYSLYGVVEHSGTLHGGHYVAYVKVCSRTERRLGVPPKGKWYYISDSYVKDVDESEVLKTQAYLLFYERILSSSST